MKSFRLRRPSPALVVATVALVVAMGGTAYAGFSVPKNSVGSKQLKKNAVTTKKIKNGAVTANKINTSGLTVPNATNATNATNANNANALGGQGPSAFASSSSEPFHEVGATGQPAFENGYSNFGGGFSTAGFYKDSLGVVHLKGTMHNGTAGTTAFILPPGYRPSEDLFMPEASGGTAHYLYILTDGSVQPQDSTGDIGLDGLSFRAG